MTGVKTRDAKVTNISKNYPYEADEKYLMTESNIN